MATKGNYVFEFEGQFYSALAIYHDITYMMNARQPDQKVAEVKFMTTKSFKHVTAMDSYEFIQWHHLISAS